MATISTVNAGDIFESDADALVNPVNTVGVMGKGLARAFKSRYPEIDPPYRADCRAGVLQTGAITAYATNSGLTVICLPTKRHWRQPSQMAYIETGMAALVQWANSQDQPLTIAIPALGCGLGELNWNQVHQVIRDRAAAMGDHVVVFIYAPR